MAVEGGVIRLFDQIFFSFRNHRNVKIYFTTIFFEYFQPYIRSKVIKIL